MPAIVDESLCSSCSVAFPSSSRATYPYLRSFAISSSASSFSLPTSSKNIKYISTELSLRLKTTTAIINLPKISILATLLSLITIIHTLPTNSIEDFANVNFLCLTPDSTILDYCTASSTGIGLPLRTRTCKNLCTCTIGGGSGVAVNCQPYGCCNSLDIFNACTGPGHCDCYLSSKRDGSLLAVNATVAVEDVGGPKPVGCGI